MTAGPYAAGSAGRWLDVYVDNDVSAYSGKPRPAWNRLKEDVRSGASTPSRCGTLTA